MWRAIRIAAYEFTSQLDGKCLEVNFGLTSWLDLAGDRVEGLRPVRFDRVNLCRWVGPEVDNSMFKKVF